MRVLEAEPALPVATALGEGCVWDVRDGALLFVDIVRGLVHRWIAGTAAIHTWNVGVPVGAVGLRRSGGYVLAVRDGFAVTGSWRGALEPVAGCGPFADGVRMNDGACDPAGRFWAGTMAEDLTPGAGALFRLDTDGTVSAMVHEVGVSNGIDWAPDGETMYYVDSLTGGVDAFAFDPSAGTIGGRRRFASVAGGAPDGLTVDADGRVWVAVWGGACVRCFAPDGTLHTVVEVAAPHVTSCCFGDDDLGTLYITTASAELDEGNAASAPHAGDVFAVRPGCRGRPPGMFGG